jgi:hypothetical protein
MAADDLEPRSIDSLRAEVARVAGMPPTRRYRLLTARLDDPQGAVRLREDLTADELEQSAIFKNARLFLDKLADSPRSATAKGYLNRGFVLEMAAEMHMPAAYAEMQPHVKIAREADVWPLEVLRVVLQVAGLIRKYKGAFVITRRGVELRAEAAAGSLFAHLFRTYFCKFNIGYMDDGEDAPHMQAAFAHSLWMTGPLAGDWVDVRTLAELILSDQDPDLLAIERELARAGREASRWVPEYWWRFERLVLRPLVEFGLLESRVDPAVADDLRLRYSEPRQVRKTPLFDRFVEPELALSRQVVTCGSTGEPIARLKVKMKDISPPIWRRIEVPLSFTFRQLSDAIVASLAWSNSHLHEFRVGKRGGPGERWLVMAEFMEDRLSFFGAPPEEDHKVQLAEILRSGEKLAYTHDFGDDWDFDIVVEAVFAAEEGVTYPRVTHGKRAAPPEDCGGPWGYQQVLDVLNGTADPEDDADRIEWMREQYPYFDPEKFDLEAANEWVIDPQPFWE